ncbi:MAG: hypothetical protein D6800_06355 [Candidatus Zixiibacteriota bacterium]|nr:MAG: hypothetical protein D6800_06355 [candidate division Zixibacteria bacterium]
MLMIISTLVGLSGIFTAWLMYYRGAIDPVKLGQRFRPLYTLLYNKYYFDEIYQAIIINPLMRLADWLWSFDGWVIDGAVNGAGWLTIMWSRTQQWFDTWIIDGAVNGCAWIVQKWAALLRYLQNGRVQFYILFIGTVVVLFSAYKIDESGRVFTSSILPLVTAGVLILWLVSRWMFPSEPSEEAIEEPSVAHEREEVSIKE